MDKFIDQINNFTGNPLITAFLIALIPLIELKGAIIWARASDIGFFISLITSYFGSTIVAVPIFFLLLPILNALKKVKWFNKFACKVEAYFQNKAEEIISKRKGGNLSAKRMKQIGVFIFVAIPLPMTGVWTGTAIAVFLNLKFKEAILPIILGNLVAGIIIAVLAELFSNYLNIILWILFGLAALLFVVFILKIILSKPKKG